MEDQWLSYVKRLQALAATGLHYTHDAFDRERFEEIDAITRDMLSGLGQIPLAALAALPHRSEGYATPKIDIRAAVFRDQKLLLVREAGDGKWTMPGGFADIGLSPAENAVKETWEEASLKVRAAKLTHIRHRAKDTHEPDYLDFYKFFFLCWPEDRLSEPAPGHETTGAGYFELDDLPDLSAGRTAPEDISEAWAHLTDPARHTRWH